MSKIIKENPFLTVEQAAYYLGALIDGEGCVLVKDKAVAITSTDDEILSVCAHACNLLQLNWGVYSMGKPRHTHYKQAYEIKITSKPSLLIIQEVVPIFIVSKSNKLTEILDNYTRTNYVKFNFKEVTLKNLRPKGKKPLLPDVEIVTPVEGKTCCHGHPWTEESTYIDSSGCKICRVCRRLEARIRAEKKRIELDKYLNLKK